MLVDRAFRTVTHLLPCEDVVVGRRKVRPPSTLEPTTAFVPQCAGCMSERRVVRERGPLRRVEDELVPCSELAKTSTFPVIVTSSGENTA